MEPVRGKIGRARFCSDLGPSSLGALWLGLVAQRITRLTTDQKIPGSNPGKVAFFFFFEPQLAREVKVKKMASEGIEPSTLALLAPRSNQLS